MYAFKSCKFYFIFQRLDTRSLHFVRFAHTTKRPGGRLMALSLCRKTAPHRHGNDVTLNKHTSHTSCSQCGTDKDIQIHTLRSIYVCLVNLLLCLYSSSPALCEITTGCVVTYICIHVGPTIKLSEGPIR